MENSEQFEPEKGEIRYDKKNDVLHVSFYDAGKENWVSLTVENLKKKSKYFPEDDILWVAEYTPQPIKAKECKESEKEFLKRQPSLSLSSKAVVEYSSDTSPSYFFPANQHNIK